MKTEISIKKRFLIFPIGKNVNQRKIAFYKNGELFDDIDIRLDYENPFMNVYYDVSDHIGCKIDVSISEDIIYQDAQSESIPEDSYYYNRRPEMHFSPRHGWLNDPNGLVCYSSPVDSEVTYHMFYQYNPYDTIWSNMHWGHAVSKDLVHWQHKPVALFPDKHGTVFSGSAIIDKENLSGLKSGNEDVILLFYTAAGGTSLLSENQEFTQCMAYSVDGGNVFKKYENNPIIPHVVGGNRDPKVVWCEEMKCYIMALYLENSTYALFRSNSFLNWEKFQEIELLGDAECPDFYPISVEGNNDDRKWILSGASHKYIVCEYKDNRFNIIQDVRALNYSTHSYASQTFSDMPDGRRICIDWDRGIDFPDAVFNGQLGVPTEIKLRRNESEYFLCATPAEEIKTNCAIEYCEAALRLERSEPLVYSLQKGAYYIELELEEDSKNEVVLRIFGGLIRINSGENCVCIGKDTVPICLMGKKQKVILLIDSCTAEVFTGDGQAMMTVPFLCDYNIKQMSITATEHTVIDSMKVLRYNSGI